MAKANEAICDVLIEAGVDYVFGIPGGGTIPIWDSLLSRQDRIKAILVRHEQAAACMADMYGRLTGKPAVLMGQGPFIASSGGFGILEAFLSSSPMLVITDTSDAGTFSQHGTYQVGTGEYGAYDLKGILQSMSKYTTYAVTPEEAVQGVQLAIKHATVGRPGPACVVMRFNTATEEIDPKRIPKIYPTSGYLKDSFTVAPAEQIAKAVDLILNSQHPVIIAGNGVHISKAYGELLSLSEFLGAPVATSYKGKSAMAEVHPMALGMMGTFGQKTANDWIAAADCLIVVGCHLAPSDTKYESPKMIDPSRQKIVQIDIDPRNAGWVYPVEMNLIGDLRMVLNQLLEKMKGGGEAKAPGANERMQTLAQKKREGGWFDAPECHSDASPILPQRIVKAIEDAVDGSTLITLDAGNNRLWMSHFFQSKASGTVFCPGGVAGMGWGPPAALAAKLLNPDKPVLSVVGDGGFAMQLHVLSTAIQYQLPVVFLVMNNSVLGMVRDGQRGRIISSEFVQTDFAQIARGFGCNGVNVSEPGELTPAIKKALKATKPTVIDAATSTEEPFFKMFSR